MKLIFSGGGTGGHIYPAIAVANEILQMRPDTEFLFVGANGKMEMTKVPAAGFKIEGLNISGLQRKLTLSNLNFPFKVIGSFLRARKILSKFRPDAVAGFGGYASGPIMLAATKKGLKTLIQEQNSYAGIANKSVSKKVDKICVAYDGMDRYFPSEKIVKTGNPVRGDIIDLTEKEPEAIDHFKLNPELKTILVLGGSLGARTINEAMIQRIEDWISSGVQIMWQTGKLYNEEMKTRMVGYDDENIRLLEFIDRMDLAYAVADVVISRAGALSISELCLVKKPVIFVPSPNVAEDHQTKNALALSQRDAALVVNDADAIASLKEVSIELINNKEKQDQLSRQIAGLGKPNATKDIANEVLKLAEERRN